MIYPKSFESKLAFVEIRRLLRGECLSVLGSEKVDQMRFSTDAAEVNEWLSQVREFRSIQEGEDDFPLNYFFDVRSSVARIRVENTHLEESELFDLRRTLESIHAMVGFLRNEEAEPRYPALYKLTEGVVTFSELVGSIDRIIDKFGRVRDDASDELLRIRQALKRVESGISRTLNTILRAAQVEGIVEKDASPTMRDGRLMIPVVAGLKRKVRGIVHDESASRHTVFIEPAEVVEANNKIRELEADERREIIVILTAITRLIRPHIREILDSFQFMAMVDFIRAKAEVARSLKAVEPKVSSDSEIDWTDAVHPLLRQSLERLGKDAIPLDIRLTAGDENRNSRPGSGQGEKCRLLIISGPNAGGKSVCLKTVGLLQYMVQCGLSIPIGANSKVGMFESIMIDIGDEQSIENDLSTYSSHLLNMKQMMRHAGKHTLLLIDEFGSGTEPQIGGAIAEAVLRQLWKSNTFGIITTHYQNLKHFAEEHEGVVNGAMLYDRQEMQPLFKLSMGRPGSSFAIEIARKAGIPEEVIRDASEIVGSDYIQSDKYLQDIVRDRRYWESKRQAIHKREKDIERTIAQYESSIADIEGGRKEILRRAKEQAEELLVESNRRIENTIREIREAQAEREETRRIREELDAFRATVGNIDARADDGSINKKGGRKSARKAAKGGNSMDGEALPRRGLRSFGAADGTIRNNGKSFGVGQTVRIKGSNSTGTVESVAGANITVIFGGMRMKVSAAQLEPATAEKKSKLEQQKESLQAYGISRETREIIDTHRRNFSQDLDVRGMRGDEALNAVTHFIDDAILMGMSRVRILHGKGDGILRHLVRQYLNTVPNITDFSDEHVQFGGAGITVVNIA